MHACASLTGQVGPECRQPLLAGVCKAPALVHGSHHQIHRREAGHAKVHRPKVAALCVTVAGLQHEQLRRGEGEGHGISSVVSVHVSGREMWVCVAGQCHFQGKETDSPLSIPSIAQLKCVQHLGVAEVAARGLGHRRLCGVVQKGGVFLAALVGIEAGGVRAGALQDGGGLQVQR